MSYVLIIDDDAAYRHKVRSLLNKNGIETREASTMLEVVTILMRETEKIGLVLLDIQMPDADGKDVSEVIKDYTNHIPIIVNSVLPLHDQRLKVSRARDYHQKGDSELNLLKKIKAVLGL